MPQILQTVLVPRRIFGIFEAIGWCREHKYKVTKLDMTKDYFHFRQTKPSLLKDYYTVSLPNGVLLVYMGS